MTGPTVLSFPPVTAARMGGIEAAGVRRVRHRTRSCDHHAMRGAA